MKAKKIKIKNIFKTTHEKKHCAAHAFKLIKKLNILSESYSESYSQSFNKIK